MLSAPHSVICVGAGQELGLAAALSSGHFLGYRVAKHTAAPLMGSSLHTPPPTFVSHFIRNWERAVL